jgi:hypothetical protein
MGDDLTAALFGGRELRGSGRETLLGAQDAGAEPQLAHA